MLTLLCSSKTNPKALGTKIFHNREEKIRIETIGAGAINQAMKAIAYANVRIDRSTIKLCCVPHFENLVSKDGKTQNAIVLEVL